MSDFFFFFFFDLDVGCTGIGLVGGCSITESESLSDSGLVVTECSVFSRFVMVIDGGSTSKRLLCDRFGGGISMTGGGEGEVLGIGIKSQSVVQRVPSCAFSVIS
jgi:hypothetical protein